MIDLKTESKGTGLEQTLNVQGELLARSRKSLRSFSPVFNIAARFIGAYLIASTPWVADAIGKNGTQAQETLFPSTLPKSEHQIQGQMPSQEALMVIATPETQNTLDSYGPEVTREWLEANPQDITATTYVNDENGNVVKQYVVLANDLLYESALDQATSKFSEFKAISKIPMENIRSLVSSSDGNIFIAGGESIIRTGLTTLHISYDKGKTWEAIGWPYQLSGVTIDLLRLTDSNYLGNNGNYEGGVGQFIINIDPSQKIARVQATSLTSIQPVNPNIGSAHELGITSLNTQNNRVRLAANGAFNLRRGINLIDLDYRTGQGILERIDKVWVDGVQVNLGYLDGRGIYTDTQGHMHFVSSDWFGHILYDIDTVTKNATQTYYAGLLNGRIPNCIDNSLVVMALDIVENQGNRKITAGGGCGDKDDGLGRALLFDLETLEYYNLAPSQPSGIAQKDLRRLTINGVTGYEVAMQWVGKAFKPDGGTPVYTDRGLGSELVISQNRLYLPDIAKNYMSGW